MAIFDFPASASVHGLEILAQLGDGIGFGSYQARLHDGSMAFLLPAPPASSVERRSFMAWAYKRAQVEHPGLPRLLAIEENEPVYAAFEWVEGVALESRLQTTVLSDLEALGIVFQVAAALRALHRQGLSHGQLSVRQVILRERPGAVDGAFLTAGCPPLPGSLERQLGDDLSELGRILYECLTPSEAALRRSPGDGSALPISIDLDRRELLKSFGVHRHFGSVEDLIQALLPHLQAMIDQGRMEVTRQFESESALAREVERVEREQRELETRLRSLRAWLRDNNERIEESARCRDRCNCEEKALNNLEIELSMLLDRPLRRKESRAVVDYSERRSNMGGTLWTAAVSAVPPRPSRMPAAVTGETRRDSLFTGQAAVQETQNSGLKSLTSVDSPAYRSERLSGQPSRPAPFSAPGFTAYTPPAAAQPFAETHNARQTNSFSELKAVESTTSPYASSEAPAPESPPEEERVSSRYRSLSSQSLPAVSNPEPEPEPEPSIPRHRLPRTGRRKTGKGRLLLGLMLAVALGIGALIFLSQKKPQKPGVTSDAPQITQAPPTLKTADSKAAVHIAPPVEEGQDDASLMPQAPDATFDSDLDGEAMPEADAAFGAAMPDAEPEALQPPETTPDAAARWPERAEIPQDLPVTSDAGDIEDAGEEELDFEIIETAPDAAGSDPDAGELQAAKPLPEGMVAIPAGRLERRLTEEQVARLAELCRSAHGRPAGICNEANFKQERDATPIEIAGFYIDIDEVTQGEYARCRAAKKCHRLQLHWDLDTQPATALTRSMAEDYCRWKGGRLPTSDEWMWAARGADLRIYPWGDSPVNDGELFRANYGQYQAGRRSGSAADGFKYAAPIKIFGEAGQSPFGVRNMSGNAREWTSSSEGAQAIVMGGSWRDLPHELRVTRREKVETRTIDNDLGFRCVIDP